jgi:hypothetical protein
MEKGENMDPIYLICSGFDWFPTKMKTRMNLSIEKVGMQDQVPATTLQLDNRVLLVAQMLPPGKHYFYFVQKPERVFLSAQYPIVRFKDTNMFVNRIELKPKKHEFTSVFTLKEGVEDEEVFLIDHSVFAKYECE